MENKRPELEMNLFTHKGEPHYSFHGRFLSCRDYAFQQSLGKDRDTIMFKARSFEELFKKQDEEEKAKPKTIIENIKQLMVFISNECLSEEERKEIKVKYTKEMTVDEKVALFPSIYQACLRMYQEHKTRNKRGEQRELQALEKTVTKPGYYNPDAFIEGSSE